MMTWEWEIPLRDPSGDNWRYVKKVSRVRDRDGLPNHENFSDGISEGMWEKQKMVRSVGDGWAEVNCGKITRRPIAR
jgi:hypothetical protein